MRKEQIKISFELCEAIKETLSKSGYLHTVKVSYSHYDRINKKSLYQIIIKFQEGIEPHLLKHLYSIGELERIKIVDGKLYIKILFHYEKLYRKTRIN